MQKSKKESSDQLSNTYKFYFYFFFYKSVERIKKKSQMLSPGEISFARSEFHRLSAQVLWK